MAFHCDYCGRNLGNTGPYRSFTTGYGVTPEGLRYCYRCCGIEDREYMQDHDRMTLYLVQDGEKRIPGRGLTLYPNYKVTNWPGTLRLPVYDWSVGGHNMTGRRVDVWFRVDGRDWWGVRYGDNTQLLHCRKLKEV